MKKKFLSVLLIVAVLIGMAGVSGTQTESGEQKADKEQKQQENEQTAETKVEIPPENEEEQKGWIGVILNGDETEAYTLAHIDGIRAAAENVSLPEQDIIWKERVGANDGCKSAVKDLIRQGCEIIIANSAIYEEAIKSENLEKTMEDLKKSKTQVSKAYEYLNKIITFLSDNKSSWTFEDGQITFNSQTKLNQYNELVKEIPEID